MYKVGVDIGGMSIKIGLVDDNGQILSIKKIKTEKNASKVLLEVVDAIKSILNEKKISIGDVLGIGIGCPGSVDRENGKIDILPNLDWENVEIVDIIREKLPARVEISNDANVAALGEALYGVAKNYNTSIMFTLGTGVGGGIVIDRKLYEGGFSRGAELGHVTLIYDGEQCTCGRKGCIERYVSATALINQTKRAMALDRQSKMWNLVGGDIDRVDGRTAFDSAKEGDESAKKVVDQYVAYLSESIMNMLNIFRPDAFILGGGISGQGDDLVNPVKEYLDKFDYGYKNAPRPEILVASLGNDAGIIGAAALLDD